MPTAGEPPRRRRPAWLALVPIPLGLGLQYAASQAPAVVERVYATALFPVVGGMLGIASGWFAWSAAELLLGLLLLGLLACLLRRPPWRALLRHSLAATGLLYLAFLLLWGLNYHRQPLAHLLGLDPEPAAATRLEALCRTLQAEADALRAPLPEDSAGVLLADVAETLARAPAGLAALGRERPLFAGRATPPKPILFSRVFSYLGISGIYAPFTGEANVNVEVPAPDLGFSASHELAHQRGIAREDEANYVAWLACRRHPDRDFRYSGTLSASLYGLQALYAVAPRLAQQVAGERSPAVQRDVQALTRWVERYRGPARTVAHAVNDAYLKANGQPEGIHSYGRMVDLLLAESREGPLH